MLRLHPDDIKAIARAVVIEMRRLDRTSDEMDYICTLPASEIKKYMRDKRNRRL